MRDWCAADDCGGESWILLENGGQARWLRRRLAEDGRFGVRIFDVEELRAELARLAGMEPPPGVRAEAELVVKVAMRDAVAGRSAGLIVEACDALARAGWHLNQLRVDEDAARRINRGLERTALIPGFFDRRLRERLPPQPARLCCIGWDALRWPDIGLLDAVVEKVAAFQMYVPAPRLPADGLQREWIEALERRFSLERVICPESGFSSANEPLVARLENSQLASRGETAAPLLLVGRGWEDQVGLACRQVLAWLAEEPAPADPIGIIAPEGSATALAVTEGLLAAGVQMEHPGRTRIREAPGPARIIEQVARYHIGRQDLLELLELANLICVEAREAWADLELEAVRDLLDRAFSAAQSRNSRILARALPRRTDAAWEAVKRLVEILGRWDGDPLPWSATLEKWEALLSGLRLPLDGWGADWAGARRLFQQERVPGIAFMEWIAARMAARRTEKSAEATADAAAQVVVTTFVEASRQTWHRLLLLDSNETEWPAPIPENPFLPDAARLGLNRSRMESAPLPTTRDLRALEQARFLDLIEHCRHPVVFAGVLKAEAGEEAEAQPNDWVLRAVLETGNGEWNPEFWAAAAQAGPPLPIPALEEEERAHLSRVFLARRNALMPFDRYHFNFNETTLIPGPWAATDLDRAAKTPATFALRALFNATSTAGWSPSREEGKAVGSLAHRWMRRAMRLTDQLAPSGPAAGAEARLSDEMNAARRELEEWFGEEGLTLPLWWETCLRKTAWAARRCVREVDGWLEARYCAMEHSLEMEVRTATGPLWLKGRIDILLSDRAGLQDAAVRIYDFKTGRGKAPTLTTLAQGDGGQFAAYYLMARDAGAASAVIGIIKPEQRAREVFSAPDEEEIRARLGVLAELQRNLRFGQAPEPSSSRGAREELPLATVPIDGATLSGKASLHLFAT